MSDVTNKQQLIEATRASWDALQAEIAPLSDDQLLQSGITDGWSIKDSLAHISAWERMFISWLEALMRGERPDRPANMTEEWVNETNARVHAEHRNDSLDDVRAESRASHEAILVLIDGLSEEALFDPQHFPWMRGRDMAPWLRGNADEHYDEHREHIAAWRARNNA
jgi:hypothetical protein